MKRTTTIIASVALSCMAVSGWNVGTALAGKYVEAPPVQDCQEDDPCWDCETMGNQKCGPVVLTEPLVIERPAPVAAAPTYNG